jgi:hypothetical protein
MGAQVHEGGGSTSKSLHLLEEDGAKIIAEEEDNMSSSQHLESRHQIMDGAKHGQS